MARVIVGVESPNIAVTRIAETLKSKILNGRLEAGARLKESLLAQDYAASRHTVRSALTLLESTGLVGYSPNKGWVVWRPTEAEILDLYLARYYLETAAARAVTPTTDFGRLTRALDALLEAYASGEVARVIDTDLEFHSAIVSLMGSKHLNSYYARLIQEMKYCFFTASMSPGQRDTEQLRHEHEGIYQALTSGGAERAERIIAEAILTGREEVPPLVGHVQLIDERPQSRDVTRAARRREHTHS